MVCIPKQLLQCNVVNYSIDHLYNFHAHGYGHTECHPANAKWLLGYIIPPFQRPLVWSKEQMIRFVESAWLGLHLGTYVVNIMDFVNSTDAHPLDRLLIDGQQRLNALRAYWDNEFPVFGSYWSEVFEDKPVYRRFRNIQFGMGEVQIKDEAILRDLYNRLNFGGTAHTDDQRA